MSTHRCPTCGASVRPDAPWCLLCHCDLRPPPEPVAAAPPLVVRTGPAALPESTNALLRVSGHGRHARPSEVGWPCGVCSATNDFDSALCAGCGATFMAALRTEGKPVLPLPILGRLTRLSRHTRLGISVGVSLVLALLLVGVTLLLGAIF